jgi:hypothetical protein
MSILVNIISNDLYLITNHSPLQVHIYIKSKIIRNNMKYMVLSALYRIYPDKNQLIKNIFRKHTTISNINRNLDNFINKYDIIIN